MAVSARTLLAFFGSLLLGYVVILLCILTGYPGHSSSSSGGLRASPSNSVIESLKGTIESQNNLIVTLEEELISLRKEKQTLLGNAALIKKKDKQLAPTSARVQGLVVLGMHRSGTSVLGGLINKMGLKTGGPLIQPVEDNSKGFFERIDVVLQNDYLMKLQKVHYGSRTEAFDTATGLHHALVGLHGGGKTQDDNGKDGAYIESNFFNEGKRALKFLNDETNYPWMLKDPRLCITLRTWLPLLNAIPAVLFTYRHPMDVARSLHKRYELYPMGKGLRLWYVYNRRAVQQSRDLCRVVTSHKKIMEMPMTELRRIREELKNKCNMVVPRDLPEAEVSEFVDVKLEHGHNDHTDHSCEQDHSSLVPPKEQWSDPDPEQLRLYREVMRVYCAMESGEAFKEGFQFDTNVKDTNTH